MHEIAGTGARDDRHQNHHRLGFFLGLARRVVHEHVFRPAGGRGLHGRKKLKLTASQRKSTKGAIKITKPDSKKNALIDERFGY